MERPSRAAPSACTACARRRLRFRFCSRASLCRRRDSCRSRSLSRSRCRCDPPGAAPVRFRSSLRVPGTPSCHSTFFLKCVYQNPGRSNSCYMHARHPCYRKCAIIIFRKMEG